MIKLYHGTSAASAAKILDEGKMCGPAYFTPRREVAGYYGDVIVDVLVDEDELMIDFDLAGGLLLDVDDANRYSGEPDWTIYDYLDAGQSVGIPHDVCVRAKKRSRR